MKWMDSVLESGDLAGKIVCPNKKCGVKIGNYDWAGVCCGCKEWVTPASFGSLPHPFRVVDDNRRSQGFCIHRSKVDEIVVS